MRDPVDGPKRLISFLLGLGASLGIGYLNAVNLFSTSHGSMVPWSPLTFIGLLDGSASVLRRLPVTTLFPMPEDRNSLALFHYIKIYMRGNRLSDTGTVCRNPPPEASHLTLTLLPEN